MYEALTKYSELLVEASLEPVYLLLFLLIISLTSFIYAWVVLRKIKSNRKITTEKYGQGTEGEYYSMLRNKNYLGKQPLKSSNTENLSQLVGMVTINHLSAPNNRTESLGYWQEETNISMQNDFPSEHSFSSYEYIEKKMSVDSLRNNIPGKEFKINDFLLKKR